MLLKRAQFNLIAFAIFIVLSIMLTIYFFFTSLSLSSEKKTQSDVDIYINLVYRSIMSPKCLGDYYHPLGHVNTSKLSNFLSKYINTFLPCVDDPKYGYTIKINCKYATYNLGIQFPTEKCCIRKVFPGEVNGELCNVSITVCTDSYSRFLSFLYNVCNNFRNQRMIHATFLFSREISIKSDEICEGNVCNKIYCGKNLIWYSNSFYGLFDVFAVYNKSSNKIIIV